MIDESHCIYIYKYIQLCYIGVKVETCNNKYPCAGEYYCPSQYFMYRIIILQFIVHSVYLNASFCDLNIILYCVRRKNLL